MDEKIPVVAEQIEVDKRIVETARVQVSTRVVEVDEEVSVPLRREEVEIETVSINRVVEELQGVRQEGDVTIVPVYEEVMVVTKRWVLKEELRITRRTVETASEPQHVRLRREQVDITRTPVYVPD